MKKIKHIISIFTVFFLSFMMILPCYAEQTKYVWSNIDETVVTNTEILDTKDIKQDNTLNLESGAAVLIEQNSGQILYAHNIHEQLRPASVTKVMSILLIMEQINNGKLSLSDQVSCSENASSMGGSQIWLDTRETLTVDEMLKAICIVSANDCVMAMAEHIAGSEEAFVQMMNDKAKELGMNNTTFKNCHGIDEDGHMTTAYDIALMSRELLTKYSDITKYTTMWMETLRNGKSELINTNKLIRNYKGITGLKTGSTSLALYNLSASATRDDLSLIAVIMKGPTSQIRFNEAQKLLDYGFSSFSYKQFANQGDVLKTVNVQKGVISEVEVMFDENCGALISKGQDKDLVQNITLEETVQAPIEKGQKIGEVTFMLGEKMVSKVDVIAKESVEKVNIVSMAKYVYKMWFNLIRF